MSKQRVVDGVDGFNSVSAWLAPNGDLIISLTHRNTDDNQVLVRVREDSDVLTDLPVDHWEDETTQLGRLNTGGDWDG